jgi:hypothetical protein
MKIAIFITFLFASTTILSQDSITYMATWSYFKANNIPLNILNPPKGYATYYNCDSMLFVRGNFNDTIKIWTPGVEWMHTLEQFKDLTRRPEYGKTVFPKSIFQDGRILVETYAETVFVFRNDSLYEIEDTVSKPAEYYSMIVNHVLGRIDEATFTRKKDSIDLLYKDRHVYLPKLIFAKTMFQQGKKKVKLSPRFNFEQDEIELEREWIENGRKCYIVRINNRFKNEKTSYAYAINADLKFIWWEGCNIKNGN